MANIKVNRDKSGNIKSYRLRCCLGRDASYNQVWRSVTIPRPEGLTPARERKEVERIADQWEQEQRAEYERAPSTVDRGKITFAEFVKDHWLPDHVHDGTHAPKTAEFYERISGSIVEYFGEKKKLRQISAEDVKRFLKYLNTEAVSARGESFSKYTVKHYFNVLRVIMEYAVRFHYIQSDPCRELSAKEKPQLEKKPVDFLKPEDAVRFMKALENEPLYWRALFNVLITTGLRRGECVGLQWGDLDDKALTLHIERNITVDTKAEDGRHIGKPKSGEARTVPISPRVYALLQALKREQEQNYGKILHPERAYIFCDARSPFLSCYPTEPTRQLRKIVKRYKLPDVSPHDLRHSAATLALESGADLKQVQNLLGHSDPSTTLKFYAGITEQQARRTVEGIENILTGTD